MSKFVSIDIETTGLNEKNCQIIAVGAVIDDCVAPLCKPPEFHYYVAHEVYSGEPYALQMHPKIFRYLADNTVYDPTIPVPICKPLDLPLLFDTWLIQSFGHRGPFTVTGKNYAGFDDRFLRQIPGWGSLLRHRVLDPGSLYYEPTVDKHLPGTEECLRRAGMDDIVTHTALEDAIQVAKLIQKYYEE